MTYHRVVATCGTSGFSKQNLLHAWLGEHAKDQVRWSGPPWKPNLVEGGEAVVLKRWKQALPAVEDPKKVSAEYSAVYSLHRSGHLGRNPDVALIHTDTPDGALAAKMIQALLERDFNARVVLRVVDDLNVEDRTAMRRSLGRYMHLVADELRKGEPRTTCFAPLGGYKVMTSLGYVAGAFLRFPTAYLHENNQVLHEIPWLPVRVDEDELVALAPLIRRTRKAVAWADLTADEQRQVGAYAWLFEQDGDVVALNAFGEFLREEPRYRVKIGPRVRASSEVLGLLERADQRLQVAEEVEELLRKLEKPLEHRGELHHEASFRHRDTPWHLYKGSSGRDGVFRAVYRYDEACDTLDLRRVWLNHDVYERDAVRRAVFEARPEDEVPSAWTDVGESVLAGS